MNASFLYELGGLISAIVAIILLITSIFWPALTPTSPYFWLCIIGVGIVGAVYRMIARSRGYRAYSPSGVIMAAVLTLSFAGVIGTWFTSLIEAKLETEKPKDAISAQLVEKIKKEQKKQDKKKKTTYYITYKFIIRDASAGPRRDIFYLVLKEKNEQVNMVYKIDEYRDDSKRIWLKQKLGHYITKSTFSKLDYQGPLSGVSTLKRDRDDVVLWHARTNKNKSTKK